MESVEYLGFLIEVVSPETGTYEYSVFDMTGKDKPEFSMFETDDVEFVSYEAAVEDAKSWIRDFLIDDDERAAEHIEKLYATKKALSSSQSLETTGRVLQRLTVDVFNRPDCPTWARYAAVNVNGKATLFSDTPSCHSGNDRWIATYSSRVYVLDDELFDASDWRNSLIERHVFQKLTVGVFDRPGCPEWANYAAVNSRGTLIFFGNEPCFEGEDYGCWSCSGYEYKHIKDEVFDATDWPNSLIERPAPQKLTADVFNRPDFPDWANYAAVDSNNKAYWFKVKPEKAETGRWWSPYGDFDRIPGKFDATDWQNSLIERPAKALPDWCKVGGYGYDHDIGYFKIVEIIDCGRNLEVEWVKEKVRGTVLGCFLEYKKQARLRPYNDDELRGLVGKTINNATCSLLVIAYSGLKHAIKINELWRTADQLFAGEDTVSGYTIDGKPCCIFEHLNDAGEWVE